MNGKDGNDGKWTDKNLQNEAMVMLINMNGKVCLLFSEKREDCCGNVFYVNLFIYYLHGKIC